jgi:transposase
MQCAGHLEIPIKAHKQPFRAAWIQEFQVQEKVCLQALIPKLIREITLEITEIEAEIKKIMDAIDSPILGVPGIGQNLGAMIIAEIGDFSRFDSADKILAFAGCSPSTYQSGQLYSSHAKMEKRGSRYLRWALLNAAAYVCNWEPTFAAYLQKKRSEGKHYYVALSHAAKKLVRVLYHLETTGETYSPTAILS